MTKSLKQHKIDALKHARIRVATKKDQFICHALNDYAHVYDYDEQRNEAVYYLKNYISKSLGAEWNEYWQGYSTICIEDWLKKQGYKSADSATRKTRAVRLNWIDWMIACYEGKA